MTDRARSDRADAVDRVPSADADPQPDAEAQPGVSPSRLPLVVAAVAFVVMVGADLLVGASPPGFYAVFGFVSCVVLILGSKALGKRLLLRDPGYYEPSGAGRVDPDPGEGTG